MNNVKPFFTYVILITYTLIGFSQNPNGRFVAIDLPCKYVQVVSEDAINNLTMAFKIKVRDNSFIVPTDIIPQIAGIIYQSDFYINEGDTIFLLPRVAFQTNGSSLIVDNITNLYNVSLEYV